MRSTMWLPHSEFSYWYHGKFTLWPCPNLWQTCELAHFIIRTPHQRVCQWFAARCAENLQQIKLLAANQAFGSKLKNYWKFSEDGRYFWRQQKFKKEVGGKSLFARNAGFRISGSKSLNSIYLPLITHFRVSGYIYLSLTLSIFSLVFYFTTVLFQYISVPNIFPSLLLIYCPVNLWTPHPHCCPQISFSFANLSYLALLFLSLAFVKKSLVAPQLSCLSLSSFSCLLSSLSSFSCLLSSPQVPSSPSLVHP